MHAYPVHYQIDRPEIFTRVQLALRVIAFLALGVLGVSFGMVFVFAYLALPAFAAIRISSSEGPRYLDDDAPRVLRALGWLAAVAAWAGLIAEQLPRRSPDERVRITVEGRTSPTARSALWRVIAGLPSALVLALLCWLGVLVWIWAALTILISRTVGPHAFHYLEGLQRWSIRLLVYQASLVDEYPPFSFADAPPMPAAHVMER